jgi:hypothetical protein
MAGALWTGRKVISRAGWDERGRRAMHATWAIWGALLLSHVLYWAPTYRVSLVLLLPAGLLLAVPFMRHEAHVHGLAACALALGCLMAPQHFWVTALMTAVTLAVGAGRSLLVKVAPPAVPEAPHPYRSLPMVYDLPAPTRFVADERARPRLLLGCARVALFGGVDARCRPGAHRRPRGGPPARGLRPRDHTGVAHAAARAVRLAAALGVPRARAAQAHAAPPRDGARVGRGLHGYRLRSALCGSRRELVRGTPPARSRSYEWWRRGLLVLRGPGLVLDSSHLGTPD